MRLNYSLGKLISIPLLPLLYFQGKKIRKKTPKLPEAKAPKGFEDNNYNSTLNLITIGESTIAGVGVNHHKNGFTGYLAKFLSKNLESNISWKVFAKSGYTVKQVSEKIIPKIKEQSVDIIVIGMGGNDAFTLNSPKKWISDIELLIKLIQNKYPNTPIFFTNMPPIKEFPAFTKSIKFVIGNLVEILGEELHQLLINKKNVFYYNEIITLKKWSKKHDLDSNNTKLYFSDGVHPSELTYKVWAKEFSSFVVKNYR